MVEGGGDFAGGGELTRTSLQDCGQGGVPGEVSRAGAGALRGDIEAVEGPLLDGGRGGLGQGRSV